MGSTGMGVVLNFANPPETAPICVVSQVFTGPPHSMTKHNIFEESPEKHRTKNHTDNL